mmetsp:Transcript_18604/g.52015  ORF Transcript_18604/g.52015 Transcript_18604/m.52015 type:complete len:127 (+) Transcript_18604:91-471(+)|eukprot:CAMPEP_0117680108 /NCGR_PEP_ID=MMETSP0804-20121206/18164_1 /TAXON_ID=1074897 /ORGANISM="Tetraselmis astigmatica, Strain CCMP880" /LENGTH=126 /DNA_ID=CAMNT_0005489559 /DNA_START=36 /DNA_END=416 /DNA_ORIENTATION=+
MDDAELEAIRQRRLAELSGGAAGGDPQAQQQQEEKRQHQEEQRQQMLVSVMSNDARERLSRIALVKPDKARGVENMILQMAQRGQLGGARVSEEQLISLLEQINEQNSSKTKVTIQRRRNVLEDDF